MSAFLAALLYNGACILFKCEKKLTFTAFKTGVIAATGLDKDALHIYVGVSVYLISLLVLRLFFKKQGVRAFIAILFVTFFALLGEYLDNQQTIAAAGVSGVKISAMADSLHDLINTCLLPYVLWGLMSWTKIFNSVSTPKGILK